jgi:transposase
MGRRQQTPLRPFTASERQDLERIAKATSGRGDQVQRARALLAVSAGQSWAAAAQTSGFKSRAGVALLVRRFNERGLAALRSAPGRGRKPTYDLRARARIVARAQQSPDRERDGTATWSLTLLQRALRREGLAQISRDTIRRVLQGAGSSYQRTRTWCPTGTALRQRKTGPVKVVDPRTAEKKNLIEHAYRLAEQYGIALWCQDEAGPYQAIPPSGAAWAPEGDPVRHPHEYVRGGTAKLLTLFRPATGEVRASGVTSAPNTVLHPWLQEELSQILQTLPATAPGVEDAPFIPYW